MGRLGQYAADMAPALALVVVLVMLAAFQIALVAGAPLGHMAWGGRERVLSSRLRRASAFSIVIYAGIAVLELDRGGIISLLPDSLSVAFGWVVFAYFCVGILLNAISGSRPERYVMTPVAVVLAVLSLLVALG